MKRFQWTPEIAAALEHAYEAGAKAERERCATIVYNATMSSCSAGRSQVDWGQTVLRQIKNEPTQPPATRCGCDENSPSLKCAAVGDWHEFSTPTLPIDPESDKLVDGMLAQARNKTEPAQCLTLKERVKKAVQNDAPLDMYVANLAQLCRDFAGEALRQVVKTKNGEWWTDEGRVWRVVSAVEPEGPSSPPFQFPGDAEAARDEIIYAAILAAEKGEVPR